MKLPAIALASALLATALCSADDPKVEHKPLAIGALHEFGQLGKGMYKAGGGNNVEVWTRDWIDHLGAFLTKEAIVNDRLYLSGGIGGVFQFRKPETKNDPSFSGSQRKGFFVGPTRAEAIYHFGDDPAKPWLKIGSGMFGYKYNPDAINLGEYLFRSGAYPAYTMTGGYVLVNGAGANLQGLKSSLDLGAFKADLLFTTETSLAPLYDWSLSGIGSYSIAEGLIELGAGVNFKRLLVIDEDRTTKKTPANGYVTVGNKSYSTNDNYYAAQAQFYSEKGNTAQADFWNAEKAAKDAALADTVGGKKPDINYYTASGILLMGRASIDFKKIFGMDASSPEDFKLYTEIAVLGVKDYPVFYDNIANRMPIMLGFNIPTFGILDLFGVQVEQYKSPWLNNTSQIGNSALNIPHFPIPGDKVLSEVVWNDLATKDDFKWSVLLKKKIGGNITLSAQVASDHLRLVSSRYYYGPQFDHNEITTRSGVPIISDADWYWMTQLSWGI